MSVLIPLHRIQIMEIQAATKLQPGSIVTLITTLNNVVTERHYRLIMLTESVKWASEWQNRTTEEIMTVEDSG